MENTYEYTIRLCIAIVPGFKLQVTTRLFAIHRLEINTEAHGTAIAVAEENTSGNSNIARVRAKLSPMATKRLQCSVASDQ